ncbi:hypothetical protein [Sphaerotilus uruguayifluvii]|uniref:Uncharacterized protein n=1 Tax=Sphaerotilus uruguayifluvii TaxID=2735897 RepID=A0ABX2FYT9_9BURK|nr:hypothetical protein [Leptothrix sp. C29]NRT55186.1 hypothetical protein [Leptothrix sp. C29]
MNVTTLFPTQQQTSLSPVAIEAFCKVFDQRIAQMTEAQLRSLVEGYRAWNTAPEAVKAA